MHLTVVAAMILNPSGHVLCVKRGESKFASTAHRWEFPGGKLEAGETPAQAAERELREELSLPIEILRDGPTVEHVYPEFSITLYSVLAAPLGDAEPILREHVALEWCPPDQLWHLPFAAADQALLLFLREQFFGAQLHSQIFGRFPTFLDTCASTNDELLRRAEAGAPEGSLVVAEMQTAGRGRLGRTWLSEPGQALLFSLLARPHFPPEIAATLPLVAGLAVATVLRDLGFDAGVKWPNDVLIGERKVCGILCEAQTSSKGIEGIVVGIGINVGAVPESVAWRAVGLAQRIDRMVLLAQICACFERYYTRWQKGALPALRAELDVLDCKAGKPITVKQATVLEGIARGIRDDGALLLETPEGITPILCGEITQWEDA